MNDNIRVIGSEENVKTQAIFENIGTGAVTTDENGMVDRINDRALKLLGFNRKEVMGKWFPKIFEAFDQNKKPIELINRPITQAFLTGMPVNTRTYYRTKSGSLLPVNIIVSPIIIDDKPVGAIEVFEDASVELEIDRMKSEFISIASHQLRTPLTSISIYAQMLADGIYGDLNPAQLESMETIIKATRRMNRLISALLDISKLENGKINIKYSHIDMKKITTTIIKDHGHQAARKNIPITLSVTKGKFRVASDELLAGEIVSNLISNAIKYTPVGGKIYVSLKEKNDEIILEVKDTGYGIPKEFHDKVFTKFSRASNIESIDTTGSGLGLYLAREIANTLGGRLWFKSRENKGTSFYFSLPKAS